MLSSVLSQTRHHWRQWLTLILLTQLSGAALPAQPVIARADPVIFQVGVIDESVNDYITFHRDIPEECTRPIGCGPPPVEALPGAMTATFSNIVVLGRQGMIGGDVLEFDVTITNTSPADSGVVLTAFAFQSKFSESPALASRIGDKLFYATAVDGPNNTDGPMDTVKKNGTSNGLFSGKWKGVCINSSEDFLPEFNSGQEDESLECAGSRTDEDSDGEPELDTDLLGLRPGESQTIRLRLDSGTTDGALHRAPAGTLIGTVRGAPILGPNGLTYFVPSMAPDPENDDNVLEIVEFGDNKVLRQAGGAFDPTFAPLADGFTFANQQYLTLPRPNYAFTDILGRNHTCGAYGLTLGACAGGAEIRPLIGFLDNGDLVAGVENFAAILHGFGEYVETGDPDDPYALPMQPYGVRCERCGGRPYAPVAEFYIDNGGGSVTRQMVAGNYGVLGGSDQYTAFIDATTAKEITQEIIPEPNPGSPPPGVQLGTSANGEFHSLTVLPGSGINGGDVIEFTIDITNNSSNADAYLTAFNFQTKERGLADIGRLDGASQDRRDIRLDSTLDPCTSLDDGVCWNAALGIGHFPNGIGNGLLFSQMVWTSADAGRIENPVDSDQVFISPTGIVPTPYWLESLKKNGPFTPILKGNKNFICIKSGLFNTDPDADAACAGEPAILSGPDGELTPGNIIQRLGLPPGQTQRVRIRMEFGDFRGALLRIAPGTLKSITSADAPDPANYGLQRFFDCKDQRELEYCHPDLAGQSIDHLPGTTANWLTPQTLEEIEYVILNQPGDAPTVMNFAENFGFILAMAGFIPSAEFYAPDPNPALVGTRYEGTLIRQQVLGSYQMTAPATPSPVAPPVTSVPD
jgi:hypothetical protein